MSNSNNSRYSSMAESRDSGDSPGLDMISHDDSVASQDSFASNLTPSPSPSAVESPHSAHSPSVVTSGKVSGNSGNINCHHHGNSDGAASDVVGKMIGEKASSPSSSSSPHPSPTSLKIGSADSAFKKVIK